MVFDSYPVDASPYGVRGMGGNMSDWCADRWAADGPTVGHQGRVSTVPEEHEPSEETTSRVRRGGGWVSFPRNIRVAARWGDAASSRYLYTGFRLARSLP